jgi:proteasome lid subunit RPN8/RPN11
MENFVHIKERAFLSMVLASVEVYRQETLGLLLGYVSAKGYVVEYGIPYQTAMKGYSWVAPKPKTSARMAEILKQMPINVIGDYHSHTQWGDSLGEPVPSGEDIADMEMGQVYIIVAVNDKTRKRRWHHTKKGTIKGTLSDYEIEIGAHICPKRYKTKSLKIICPSATGLSY